jgi:hypothetical protein
MRHYDPAGASHFALEERLRLNREYHTDVFTVEAAATNSATATTVRIHMSASLREAVRELSRTP